MKIECTAYDFMELSQREITPEGFLKAPATLARTGIQLYRAREFGLDKQGMDGDQIIRVYRPAEEVFNPESIQSFDGVPVIMEPHQTVTAENWKKLSVGDVHSVRENGQHLAADSFIVRDKKAIEAIQNGKKFLSNGYKFDLDLTPGVTSTGEAYDGIQRNIRGNHVAIVSAPRGGSACRIADSDVQGEKKMKKITVNGVPVEVGDNEAGIIEKLQADLEAARNQQPSITLKVGDASKTITGSDALIAEITTRDSQIAELKKQVVTPEQFQAKVDEAVKARVAVVGDAVKLVSDFKADGKSNLEVQREVLTKVTGDNETLKAVADAILGGKSIGDAEASPVEMAFKAVVAAFKPKVESRTGADAAMAAALTGKGNGATEEKLTGRDAFIARQNQAWQSKK